MRTRDEIANQLQYLKERELWEEMKMQLANDVVELLLDIRDLLADPPKEITGEPALHAPGESDYQRLMKYGGNGAGGGYAPEVREKDTPMLDEMARRINDNPNFGNVPH